MVADGADNTALGDLLGITEAAIDTADPVSLARGFAGAMRRAALRPWRTAPAFAKFGIGLGLSGAHLATRAIGHPLPEVVRPADDGRMRLPYSAKKIALISSDLPRENSATNAMTSLSSAKRSRATSMRRWASVSSISWSTSHCRSCEIAAASVSRAAAARVCRT